MRNTLLLLSFLTSQNSCFSQAFLNGSFEATVVAACTYNLDNTSFNALMPNVNAYGGGNEMDIIIDGCYTTGIADGLKCVGLAALYDEIAIELSAPLVSGTNYSISFSSYGNTDFRPLGDLEIGASTNNSSFGALLITVSPGADVWTNHTVTFIAPNNATHITVRNAQTGITLWNRVDNFVIISGLPNELIDFTAIKNSQQTVDLNWKMGSESQNDYFTIEKSNNGFDWEFLLKKYSQGNSSEVLSYVDIDSKPFHGMNYYRLSQTDIGGVRKEISTKMVQFVYDDLQVYPNPNAGNFTIQACDLESLKITDSYGKDVTGLFSFTQDKAIIQAQTNKLSAGIYFLHSKNEIIRLVVK